MAINNYLLSPTSENCLHHFTALVYIRFVFTKLGDETLFM